MESRIRNVATIVYPESAPSDWTELLDNTHVPAFISPIHDKDDKKPHYHVLVMFPSLKSRSQCDDFIKSFGGVGCESIASLKSYARYLCHLDHPNKAQYNPSDVRCLGGADYQSLIVDKKQAKYSHLMDIFKLCRDNHIYSFAYLLDYLAMYNQEDFAYLVDNAYVIRQYLMSITWEIETGKQQQATKDLLEKNPFIHVDI